MHKLRVWLEKEAVAGYIFIIPFIVGLFVFTIYPFFNSFYLAFTNYNILTPPKWVGLDNFVYMFTQDKLFWKSFGVTIKFAAIQVPVKMVVSLMVALILARSSKLTTGYRAAFYIPSLMGGTVAVSLTWKRLFANNGVINSILLSLGMEPFKFFSPTTALYTLVGQGVWQFGSTMLIFLAAIKNVPASYHEAAIVDGAGPVKRFFAIVLPMITPVFFFNLIQQTINALQAFNSAYLITNGGPMNSTLYYGLHLYNRAFVNFEMGYGSAMAWFMLIVIAFFTALIFRSSSAWVYYESEGK